MCPYRMFEVPFRIQLCAATRRPARCEEYGGGGAASYTMSMMVTSASTPGSIWMEVIFLTSLADA